MRQVKYLGVGLKELCVRCESGSSINMSRLMLIISLDFWSLSFLSNLSCLISPIARVTILYGSGQVMPKQVPSEYRSHCLAKPPSIFDVYWHCSYTPPKRPQRNLTSSSVEINSRSEL